MTDLIQSLSSETGASPDLIRTALAQVFAFLKRHLDPEMVQKIVTHVPGASELPDVPEPHASGDGGGGGLMGSISQAIGKIFGGKATEGLDLVSILSKMGLSLDNIRALFTKLVAFLEAHLPPELLEQIKAHLHLPAEAPAS
jgi:hypothetical protein